MTAIRSIGLRRVLNSHVQFTYEFIVELEDGSVGIGASPRGETVSIYEDGAVAIDPSAIIGKMRDDGYIGRDLQQEDLDSYLQKQVPSLGKNNAYALSLAFFNARASRFPFDRPPTKPAPPHICCNILNGGRHAYTNPVLSDFPEYLLVAKSNDISEVIEYHNEIQRVVMEKLCRRPKTVVSGNPVNCFAGADNRECIEFLLNIRDSLGLAGAFDLMIDASAGDLWTGNGYRLAVTDGPFLSSEALCDYWMGIIREYGLRFLEDPFHEKDLESWQRLATSQQDCYIIGDNLYASDAGRIEEGAAGRYTHGAIIKPNQAGTVTAVCLAVETAQRTGQLAITSHRSISTESTFLATLTCMYGIRYIKIGPLMTDYSSVVRLNGIIRLTDGALCR